jgi:Rad3-related DNA helicase
LENYIFTPRHSFLIYFQLNELGRILTNICNVIPAGIVCFFPSYEYEKLVFEHWEKNGVISKMEVKKKVGFTLLNAVKYFSYLLIIYFDKEQT